MKPGPSLPTTDPTPDPVTPTPTEQPETETKIKAKKGKTTFTNGKVYVNLSISEEELKDAVKAGKNNITILIDKENLQDISKHSDATGLVINLNLPAVENANIISIVLSTDALLLAKKFGQNLTINVKGGYKYAVNIPFTELKKVKASSKDINIIVTLKKDTKTAKGAIGNLTIGTEGAFTFGIEIKVPVSELALSKGSKVYIYRKNKETGKLEEVPNNPRTVAKDGTITLSILSGGEFIICKTKVKDAVTLLDRVNVSISTSVAKGKKLKIKINLPQELEQVTSLKGKSSLGKEMVKITYKVSNKDIATISDNGTITAKKKGTVKVTVTITLKNGQKKSFSKTIKVK